jgi:uncharacterized protein with beta-barrel porin domain
MDGFSESDGGALGLDVAKADKTIFNPVVGLTLARTIAGSGSLRLQPYAGMSYTFQGTPGRLAPCISRAIPIRPPRSF